MTTWLTLQEYSNKYLVSISTLRRKIKNRDIEYSFKNGRYFLKSPSKEEDLGSTEKLKKHYQELLSKKEQDFNEIKENYKDLSYLLMLLEQEKQELLKFIEQKHLF